MPNEEVDTMLEDCNPRKPGMVERNKPLAEAIEYFMRLRHDKDERVEHVTLAWFYETKLRPKFGGPATIDTVRRFVREVLLLDPATGKSNIQ